MWKKIKDFLEPFKYGVILTLSVVGLGKTIEYLKKEEMI